MSVSYPIGEVATITHLSVPTIRYYDKEGLIPDLKKDPAGVRCFDDHNLGALEMINCLKTAGMSIKDSTEKYVKTGTAHEKVAGTD